MQCSRRDVEKGARVVGNKAPLPRVSDRDAYIGGLQPLIMVQCAQNVKIFAVCTHG